MITLNNFIGDTVQFFSYVAWEKFAISARVGYDSRCTNNEGKLAFAGAVASTKG